MNAEEKELKRRKKENLFWFIMGNVTMLFLIMIIVTAVLAAN
ncbi:hypothetical protein [Staphylococcus gallinarum]|nr:hypothetical protein [Staphylococcus gallinarum]